MSKSIFYGNGIRPRAARIIYQELTGRRDVTYDSILNLLEKEFEQENNEGATAKYFGRSFNSSTISSTTEYRETKKAFKEVVEHIEKLHPGSVITTGRKNKVFQYKGPENPLEDEFNAMTKKSISDYVKFLTASAGFFPSNWCSSFLENTQVLLDISHNLQHPTYIRSDNEITLTNIHLLPEFYNAIAERRALRFTYRPFTEEAYELLFHPQFIKEHNELGYWDKDEGKF